MQTNTSTGRKTFSFKGSNGLPRNLMISRSESDDFSTFANKDLGMKVRIALSEDCPRIAIMVSKADHCFHDLVLRVRSGEWNANIAGVLSNHENLGSAAHGYNLNYLHLPVSKESKQEIEREQLKWLSSHDVELVILARYMQILSSEFLEQVGCPVINIHHSFLPSFAGAKPYHQAYQRGVKLIGATAHYVTEDLDEGPIIEQDVARVSHRHGPSDLIEKGGISKNLFFPVRYEGIFKTECLTTVIKPWFLIRILLHADGF